MTITTRFSPGDTVYRQYNNHTIAHTVDIVNIVAIEGLTTVTYKLTRNTNTQYPSGGELSNVQEFKISKDPE